MDLLVAGEALIDLVPRGDALVPLVGGSPVNVAVGAARLGLATGFVGTLSRDGLGQRVRRALEVDGVDTTLAPTSDRPSTLAVIHLDASGDASYTFYVEGTAAAEVRPVEAVPPPAGPALHLSFGAIGPTHPAGRALADLVARERGRRLVSFDPNVRPEASADRVASLAATESLVAMVDVVKASDADLTALVPDADPTATARRWATLGPAIVVLTRGSDGAEAFTADGAAIHVEAHPVTVVDTVGAGDAFTAGLLDGLVRAGVTDRRTLLDLDRTALARVLADAAWVAADTCTRPGADPPRRDALVERQ